MSLHLLRQLLLPLDPGREGVALGVLDAFLADRGISQEDAQGWLDSEIELWHWSGVASDAFRELAQDIMYAAADQAEIQVSQYYFGLHEQLLSKGFQISWAEARFLLSHVQLITDLARKHKMTAAKIARVLAHEATQAPRYSRALSALLEALGPRRELDRNAVRALMDEDRGRALEMFADSSLEDASRAAELAARRFGVSLPLGDMLISLADDEDEPFGPYLQMLHFILIVTEFFDHFSGEAYEFSPRGAVAEMVFEGHPLALKRGNPFLNNAKKVRVLNSAWAEGADDNLRAARGLSDLVGQLDMVAYPVRREVACIVRAWLAKVFDRFADTAVKLPANVSAAWFKQLLESLAAQQTRTGGVLEQRMVDLYCIAKHSTENWMMVGVGDSANTTNMSRRKCGDVEVNHRTATEIVAYEAHAGSLGSQYVQEHMRTLARVLSARETDLLLRGPAEEWDIRVVFVAHAFAGDLQESVQLLGGWKVSLAYLTFEEMRSDLAEESEYKDLARMFEQHALEVLGSANTPNVVRKRLIELMGG